MTKEFLQKIKESRISEPEKILLKSFKGIKEYFCTDGNIEYRFFKFNDNLLFAYNTLSTSLYFEYDLIHLKIIPYFNSYDIETDFIKKMVEKHLKIVLNVKPQPTYLYYFDENLKIKK